jgi:hypothetical protein
MLKFATPNCHIVGNCVLCLFLVLRVSQGDVLLGILLQEVHVMQCLA